MVILEFKGMILGNLLCGVFGIRTRFKQVNHHLVVD